jgi:cell division protein FtsI/penicillin-binding protein 2
MRLQELVRQRIKAGEARGAELFPESRRYYPKRTLAAHVLGAVGANGKGVSGLESKHNDLIAGQPGRVRVMVDAGRQQISSVVERPPTTGASMELTIDLRLQYIAEKELAAAMREYQAEVVPSSSWIRAPVKSLHRPAIRCSTRMTQAHYTDEQRVITPSRAPTSPDQLSRW